MKWFSLSLFGFLSIMVLMVGLFRPDLLDATLAFTGLFLTALAWVTLAGLAGAVLIGGGLLAWAWWHGKSVESLRQRDGHYPVQRVKLKTGEVVYLDLNQTIGPAIKVDRNSGEISEYEPAAGWQIQATIRGMVEQTRRAQAMFQGDASRSTQWGSQHKGDRITAAAAKLTAGGYDRQTGATKGNTAPMVDSTPAPQIEAPKAWGVRDAFQNNTNTRVVLGQTDTGQLVFWDMMQTPHLRFHGQTQGSGKTNALQTVAAGAARTGAHVIVLDRRSFKDWSEFQGIAELVDSRDPRRFAAAVLALQKVYQERDRQLGAAGAPNIMALPDAPQQVVAIVSEFGALCDQAKGEGILDDVLLPLKQVLRMAGATGVHVLLEDQSADRWPMAIATNAEPVTGYLPLNYGAAGGYHYAHKLAPYTFHYAGAVFKTWHMAPALRGLLAAAPGLSETLVSVPQSVPKQVFPGVSQSVSPEVDPPQPSTGNTGNNDPNKWDDFILDYMATHQELWQTPPKGVRDLARAMSRHETGNEASEDSYVGIASKTTKRIREEARLSTGEKLGVDVSA